MITQENLKSILRYNPETGVLTWATRSSYSIKVGDVAGHPRYNGYLGVKYKGKIYYSHRLAWLYVYGEYPKGQIDHINGDKKDNRIANLRDVDNRENHRNKGLSKNNKSGIMGVAWNKSTNKWEARIKVDYKQIHLGTYADFFEACCARKSAERKYGFHINHGRRK